MSTAAYVPLSTIEDKLDIRSPFTYGTPFHISAFTYAGNEKKRRTKGLLVYDENGVISQETVPLPCVMYIAIQIITLLSYILLLLTFPVSAFFIIKVVRQYEKIVVFRLGHYHSIREPGITVIVPCIDRCHHIDIRIKAFNVPPTQVMLADSALITVGACVYYTIHDPLSSIMNVRDFNHATRTTAQAAFHSILPNHKLSELDSNKQQIVNSLKDVMNENVCHWGLTVSNVDTSPITVLRKPHPSTQNDTLGPGITPVLQILNSYISGTMTGMTNPTTSTTGLANLISPLTLGGPQLAPGGPELPPELQNITPVKITPVTDVGERVKTGSTNNVLSTISDTLMSVDDDGVVSEGSVGHPSDPVSGPSDISPMIILGLVSKILDTNLVQSVNTVYMFNISGDNYILDLKHGSGSVSEWDGMVNPDCIISLSSSDMCELLLGQLTPYTGYMTGRLHIDGNITTAMKLSEVYTRMSQHSTTNTTTTTHQ